MSLSNHSLHDLPIWLLGGRVDVGNRLAMPLAEDVSRPFVICGHNEIAAVTTARQIGPSDTALGIDTSATCAATRITIPVVF
jgi:hypothetical protein